MTSTEALAIQLADHNARIEALEQNANQARLDHRDLAKQLGSLRNWIMGTLAAALMGVLIQSFKILATR